MEKRSSCSKLAQKRITAFVAAILSLCLVGILCFQGTQIAQAVNVQQGCSITANVDAHLADKPDDLQYQLYRVADAVPKSSSDAYTFQVLPSFSILAGSLNDSGNYSDTVFEGLTQQAAQVVFATSGIAPVGNTSFSAGSRATGFEAGLYLIVPFGADALEAGATTPLIEEGGQFVSIAYSATKKFTFSPQLIALPTKDPVNGVISTANPGPWVYDATVTFKPTITDRKGSLEIVKELLVKEQIEGTPSEATFVFDIKGYEGDDRTNPVYSNVASIVFDAAGKQSVVIDNIPAGLHVVITEAYSGPAYRPVVGNEPVDNVVQEADIHATDSTTIAIDPAQVNFSNTYNGGGNTGGSVLNTFQYENGGWEWSKDGERQQS